MADPWSSDIIEACGRNHDLRIFDPKKPAAPQFEGFEAIVDFGGNCTPGQIDQAVAAGVKFIQAQTTGLDHVHVDHVRSSGIRMAHCPGTLSAVALAETAMMYILMLAHRFRESDKNFNEKVLYVPVGLELDRRTLSIIGFGASGVELARRAKPFGMRIEAIDVRKIDDDILDELQPDFIGGPDDVDRVISEADYLSVHLHLNDETRHIIDARRIGLMKSSACMINVARGALVDEAAMRDALLNGRLGGAGLDVFEQEPPDPTLPVYKLPNVIATPHNSGTTDGTSRNRARFAAENLDRFAQGQELHGIVV
jgi:phosphoglycerate dehydrogenase-like enzyme